MNTKYGPKIFVLLALVILLISCDTPPTQPAVTMAPTNTSPHKLPDPAAVYCEQQGNRLEIRTAADGSQSGLCIFPDGSECEEWAYFRQKCGPATIATGAASTPTQMSSIPLTRVTPQAISMPAGVLISSRNDTMSVTLSMIFYNADGLTLGELLAPNALEAHAAGHYQGNLHLPLVFSAVEPDGQKYSIMRNSGSSISEPAGQVSTLKSLEDRAQISGLVGAAGQPLVFYIVFQSLGSTVRSQFMFSGVNSLPTASSALSLESSESRYWKPVAIQMNGNAPGGLWFTRTLWGIGGEIVYPYYEGLSFYDISTGTVKEVLPPEAQFNSLSTDQTKMVYALRKETGLELYIQDINGGTSVILPTLPENDRGAGNGIFSPSNKHIAWREAQGSLADGSFKQTIRVATLDGNVIGEFKDIALRKAAQLTVSHLTVQPVGWLDDENLLVQIIAMEKPYNGSVIKLNVITGEFTLLARGFFAGLFYP
jgi:putative hemolysin